MGKSIANILIVILIIYIAICVLLYFFQEYLIFFPEKINKEYQFSFDQKFEELNVKTEDNAVLNGILFKADSSKGLIFYLHGNAGSIRSWGEVAKIYTDLDFDLFMLDYRGYGKSEGSISNENQLYKDVQVVFDTLKTRYKNIIILGYSIGTGAASKLASANQAKRLILQAPYYSLKDVMKEHYPIIPTFLLKYKFETNKHIKQCTMPIIIFHGDRDEVIDYKNSIKLKQLLKQTDTLITLKGQTHNGMSYNPNYLSAIQKILQE